MSRKSGFLRLASALAATVVMGLPPRQARADVPIQATIYGFLNGEIERVWAKGGSTPYDPRFRVTDGNSRLGFTGSLSIAADTSAIWQLEGALNGFEQGGVDDQGRSSTFVSRNSFVGIQDKRFGRLIIGNNDSAYRSLVGSGGAMGGNLGLSVLGLDVWNNTSAQLSGNANSLFSRGEARYQNSVHYLTPEWGTRLPFAMLSAQIAASYGFDEARASGLSRDRVAVSGLFKLGKFALGVGFDHQSNTGLNVEDGEQGFGLRTRSETGTSTYFYKVLASYHFPTGTYLGAGFERSNYGFTSLIIPSPSNLYARVEGGTMRQNGGMASLAQEVGPLTLMASFGMLWKPSAAPGRNQDYRATQYSVGAKFAFNDNFSAYGYFTAIRNQAREDVNLGPSIYSNDLGTSHAYLAPGNSPRALGIGGIARF